jgi:hypothetical protein
MRAFWEGAGYPGMDVVGSLRAVLSHQYGSSTKGLGFEDIPS